MTTSRIFIASSGRTLELAKQLRAHLNPDYCEVDLWTEVSKDCVGESILTMLKEATMKYDFAIVLLARDDVVVTDKGDKLKARDNCVFEAGLFIATLGEKRCFLATSVAQGDLPSDLSGIIYIPFREPEDITDPDACKRAMQPAVDTIDGKVRKLGRFTDRAVSQAELLELEKRDSAGGELHMDQVVVAAIQPVEDDYVGAGRVRSNIDDGNVRYVYLFPGNKEGAQKTCQLLQVVLLAKQLKGPTDASDWRGRLDKVKTYRDEILAELRYICDEERIQVFFLPEAPPLQYCIHNATDKKNAKLYLKRGEQYVVWEVGQPAYDFWEKARTAYGAHSPTPPKAVFYGVPGFNEQNGEFPDFIRALKEAAGQYFPGIGNEVMSLCYPAAVGNSQPVNPA